VTKPRDIVKRISREAKRQNVLFSFVREGANHEIYKLGDVIIPIPRHREVNEMTTEGIYKECQDQLGKGWWRN
jgi:hypothetical protein